VNIQVGEFLETLGNKKSAFIVKAVSEYIKTHPEILNSNIQINVGYNSINKKELVKLIRKLINERNHPVEKSIPASQEVKLPESATTEITDNDINKMLENLNMFNNES